MSTETKNVVLKCITIICVVLIIAASAYYIAGMVIREIKPADSANIIILRTTDRTMYETYHYVDVVVHNEGNLLGYAVIACQFTASENNGDLLQEQIVTLEPGETQVLTFTKSIYGTWDYVVYVKSSM
ncbi:MAG: hypothetical protein FWH37_04840 [Candidatus Bathyarchaeota archaeon]|nr:hypothetical protein [Candidatus Termiticorpusculum sp.]